MTPSRTTVLAPVAAPYREPLFNALDVHPDIALTVIYGDAGQTSWDVPRDYFATAHDYPAVHLSSRQIPRPGRTPVMLPQRVERALRASKPEVIVASEYGLLAIRSRLWARRHRIPHLLFTECTPAIDELLPGPQLRWHRRFAQSADGAIAVSSAARERLLTLGVSAGMITVALQSADLHPIRQAVAARTHAPESPAEPPRERTLSVLTVGRLVPDKNLAVLLRAVAEAEVDLAPARVRLDVVGDGFLRDELKAMAADLGINVTFHGHLDATATAALYADADVFALLSSYEPFGVVIREAAAAGLPMVVTDRVGAVGDVAIDGTNAVVVGVDEISATAVALSRVLGDPARRAEMAEASRAIDRRTAGTDVDAWAQAIVQSARW